MPRPKPGPQERLNIQLPRELFVLLKRVALDSNTTMTNIIIKYLKCVQKLPHKQRDFIDDKTYKFKTFSRRDFSNVLEPFEHGQEPADN